MKLTRRGILGLIGGGATAKVLGLKPAQPVDELDDLDEYLDDWPEAVRIGNMQVSINGGPKIDCRNVTLTQQADSVEYLSVYRSAGTDIELHMIGCHRLPTGEAATVDVYGEGEVYRWKGVWQDVCVTSAVGQLSETRVVGRGHYEAIHRLVEGEDEAMR